MENVIVPDPTEHSFPGLAPVSKSLVTLAAQVAQLEADSFELTRVRAYLTGTLGLGAKGDLIEALKAAVASKKETRNG